MRLHIVITIMSCFCLICLGTLSGCVKRSEHFGQLGLNGQFDIIRSNEVQQFSGDMSGNFFLGCGSISGSVKSTGMIQFTWSFKPNQFVITTVDKSKLVVIVDTTKTDLPSVEFIPNREWLSGETNRPNLLNEFDVYKNNINRLVESQTIDVIHIRIHPDQLVEENCLAHP